MADKIFKDIEKCPFDNNQALTELFANINTVSTPETVRPLIAFILQAMGETKSEEKYIKWLSFLAMSLRTRYLTNAQIFQKELRNCHIKLGYVLNRFFSDLQSRKVQEWKSALYKKRILIPRTQSSPPTEEKQESEDQYEQLIMRLTESTELSLPVWNPRSNTNQSPDISFWFCTDPDKLQNVLSSPK